MNIVPDVRMKGLKECQDGELVLYSHQNSMKAELGLVACVNEVKIIVSFETNKATAHIIHHPEMVQVASLGHNFTVVVDISDARTSYLGNEESIGWLHATDAGWETIAATDMRPIRISLPMNGNPAIKSGASERMAFRKWSIVIDKKTIFTFDATGKSSE